MGEFFGERVWPDLKAIAKSADTRIVATAYFTEASGLHLKPNDIVIVDASNAHIKNRSVDRDLLRRLFDRGIHLFHAQGLHAKVFLLGNIACIGSANATENSRRLCEAVFASDEPALVAQVRNFLDARLDEADEIGEPFLDRIDDLALARRRRWQDGWRGRTRRAKGRPLWVISSSPMDRELTSQESRDVDDGKQAADRMDTPGMKSDWIRFGYKKSLFLRRAKPRDPVICIEWEGEDRAIVYTECIYVKKKTRPNYALVTLKYHPKAVVQRWEFEQIWNSHSSKGLSMRTTRAAPQQSVSDIQAACERLRRRRR